MNTQKLILALLAVALIGAGAHWYLQKMGQKTGVTVEPMPVATSSVATEEVGDTEPTANESASAPDPAETASPPSAAPAQAVPPPASEPASEGDIDDILTGFGEDLEQYDDSSVDTAFSGNLDEGI